TMLLEARVFRGFASTVSLCAESGKNEKGHSLNPKKQSSPKNVVEPKERVTQLTTQAAAALPKSLSPPRSPPPAGSKGGRLGSPHRSGSMLLTDEGHPQRLSGKTLVEFPQKVLPPFQDQGSDSKVPQVPRNRGDDSSSSSSSSSSTSSSSDSESDEEGDVSEVGPQVVSKGKGGFPKPEATRPFERKDPKATASAKEDTRVPRPSVDVTYPGQPRPPKKSGPSTKSVEERKAKAKPTTPSSQANEEILKKNVKEEELQNIFRSSEINEESLKPSDVKDILPDHTKAGSSMQQSGGPMFTTQTEEARAGGQLPAAAPGPQGKHLEPQVPEPGWKATFPLVREEGTPVMEGHVKTKGGILEDQVPVREVKKAVGPEEETAEPQPEERGEAAEDTAPCAEAHGHTQESAQAPVPPEPADATTYKNLQHHDYHTYTFLDLNLDLSKFRMPQPSSGRESPRH
ncbi:NADH dehydrogenase [ubiquinone] flavoprotein 3, mitochondrial, partial [Sciurus carolinensis]|nr:NADH dehydrogenase [ubiquinone] flavoprotein 3, mitochondrial [Sciurus carolinensis]